MTPFLRDLLFLAATAGFIVGIKLLGSPRTAPLGNRVAALGMLIAVVVTLLDRGIVDYRWIVAGLVVGAAIGAGLARAVKMTAMPEMVGALNGLGGAASAIVSVAEFLRGGSDAPTLTVILLGTLVGAVTFTGSFVAFGKLAGFLSVRPVTWPLQNAANLGFLGAVVAAGAAVLLGGPGLFWPFTAAAGLLGVLLVLPIGGGDMPVVISLLNSYSGVAAAMAGFALGDTLLIASGALVGASGLILTRIMCRAMNRSLANVIFGAFGRPAAAASAAGPARQPLPTTVQDAALLLANARLVIVVPGYGLAVARAQHALRELADLLAARGVEVKYAIHPVAGRMPGHMNVLLAEADVPYDRLYEPERINAEFERADAALVVGANDVVNPAARTDRSSPLFGMPILDADRAKAVIVLKRGMSPGFAGVENELFLLDRTRMLFGDAQKSLAALVAEIKASG